MQSRKEYSPEFKLTVVKEYLNGDKSQAQICEKYSISPSIFFRWLKNYKESGYDDSVFNVSRGRPGSIISDYSKIPPFIFESAGIRKDDLTNQNDTLALKRKLDYYEKILLEKEIGHTDHQDTRRRMNMMSIQEEQNVKMGNKKSCGCEKMRLA